MYQWCVADDYIIAYGSLPIGFARSRGVEKFKASRKSVGSIRPDSQTLMTGPKRAPAHYAKLKTFMMPTELYAQDGMLYLLARIDYGSLDDLDGNGFPDFNPALITCRQSEDRLVAL
jgi:hypothetical protein